MTTQAFRNALHIPLSDPTSGNVVAVVEPGEDYVSGWSTASGIPEAPEDTKLYGRKDAAWAEVVPLTGAEILAKLLTVDGPGSGLDADLLDGSNSSFYLEWSNFTGVPTTFPPSAHNHPQSEVTNLVSDLALKAPLESPTFTGTVIVPTYAPPTASGNVASTAFVANAISTVNTDVAGKVAKAGDTMTGKLNTAASAAGGAGFRLQPGVAPGTPVDGDLWVTTASYLARVNGTTYTVAFLNGSSAFTGVKTFSVPPIMATPAAGQASIRLPAGAAPSAPADGDMWGTSTGLFARVNGVTYNLTNTFPEAPTDGQQYARQNAAWAAINVPPGTIISDTAPGSPEPGQLWWESDSGRLLIWYVDPGGAPGQWVQVNAPATVVNEPSDPGIGDAPSDGAEYTRVNGVWRLKRQSIAVASAGNAIPVPAGAKIARIVGAIWGVTTLSIGLRVSSDGSTFHGATGDYYIAGIATYGGSAASPSKNVTTAQTYFQLVNSADNLNVPGLFECDLVVGKPVSPALFTARWRGTSYNNAATNQLQELHWSGYVNASATFTLTALPAFQIYPIAGSFAATNSTLSVEWIY